jgi:hypothetical protein
LIDGTVLEDDQRIEEPSLETSSPTAEETTSSDAGAELDNSGSLDAETVAKNDISPEDGLEGEARLEQSLEQDDKGLEEEAPKKEETSSDTETPSESDKKE